MRKLWPRRSDRPDLTLGTNDNDQNDQYGATMSTGLLHNVPGSQAAEANLSRPAKRKRGRSTEGQHKTDDPHGGLALGDEPAKKQVKQDTKVTSIDLSEPITKKKKAAHKIAKKPAASNKTYTRRTKNGLEEDLQPIHDLDDIFDDMAQNAFQHAELHIPLQHIVNRVFRVATMCSGTESPLLALEMIADALERQFGSTLQFEHTFSAEIVPLKQAYIERNFQPEIIFRDIRELVTEENSSTATTAYGNVVEIPSGVDILVAGFSCVDFSKLNSHTKTINDNGESGQTYRAILRYVKEYRPTIIILENILNSPFGEVCSDFNDINYAAHWTRVNTRDYYIPQTRNRNYCICIDRENSDSPNAADEYVQHWGRLMRTLRRPASSPVEAFLLGQDDHRLQYAREQATKVAGSENDRAERSWEKCLARHQNYREKAKLGSDRPFTRWVTDGSCSPPDFWWREWAIVQRERIWDALDISLLRNICRDGYDAYFKARIWDLSQNVDRAVDSTPFGLASCVTPGGIPYFTIRGGPVVGLEALSLQGIPIEKLLLTRESPKELQDLAGNAMTTTVVGAALLSGIIAGYKALIAKPRRAILHETHELPSVNEMDDSALQQIHPLDFTASENISVDKLHQMANSSVRLCYCEGQTLVSTWRIQVCKECSHTTCQKCGGNPAHEYTLMDRSYARTLPRDFDQMIRRALPMRLIVVSPDYERLETLGAQVESSLDDKDWQIILRGFRQAFGTELRFQTVKRSHCWTIYYDGPCSWLELAFTEHEVTWSLFAKPDSDATVNSRVRNLFRHPIGRMKVASEDILRGQWQIRVPTVAEFSVTISGEGDLTRSWESRLGIQQPELADKKVFPSLRISVNHEKDTPFAREVSGKYKLLQTCGTALGCLHKKVSSPSGTLRPLYLFLDPERVGNPNDDYFVFSADKHRMAYQELRQHVACLDSSWRPSAEPCSTVNAFVYGEWVDCKATLQAFQSSEGATFAVPDAENTTRIAEAISARSYNGYPCSSTLMAVLSCYVPFGKVNAESWSEGLHGVVDQASERQTFSSFAWLTERVRSLGAFPNKWRPLAPPLNFTACTDCVPAQPNTRWGQKIRKNKVLRVPYEDGKQAGEYERLIKARPPPFVTRVRFETSNSGCLEIGLNVFTLLHRALATFKDTPTGTAIKAYWHLITEYDWPMRFSMPKFVLGDNTGGSEVNHQFGFGSELRPEQQRSLHWMIRQEAADAPCFREQEIQEATQPQLGWRAAAAVSRATFVKGGVLADRVGYGKTATTLALIDSQMSKSVASATMPRSGSIPIKATLIIVPSTLISQWSRQITKFLGQKYIVVEIKNMNSMAKISIQTLQNADMIITTWSLFGGDVYLEKLSRMAAMPEVQSPSSRVFDAWLSKACERVAIHTDELKSGGIARFARLLAQAEKQSEDDEDLLRSFPSKRFRGKAYVENAAKAKAAKESGPKNVGPIGRAQPKPRDTDVFGLQKAKSLGNLKSPPLQMFHFPRLVLDEYTYVKDNYRSIIASLKATSRWVLSGTPPLADFADAKTIASFVGINLGVDDDATGVLKRQNINTIRKDRTAAEQFRAFGQVHSPAWHLQRQKQAQAFLSQFVRQNTAEVKEIAHQEILRVLPLHATERAIFMELQQQLLGQDMKIRTHGKPQTDNDRAKRLNAFMRNSKSAEEALLKCCSFFELENSSGLRVPMTGACDFIVDQRSRECQQVHEEMRRRLRQSVWLERAILDSEIEGNGDTHFIQWKARAKSNAYGDFESTRELTNLIDLAEVGYDPQHGQQFYHDPLTPAEERKKQAQEKIAQKEKEKALKEKKALKLKAIKQNALKQKVLKRKAKGKRERSQTPEPDLDEANKESDESMDDAPSDPREVRFAQDDKKGMVHALRKVAELLHKLSVELVARIRALRFLKAVHQVQIWQHGFKGKSDKGVAPHCSGCSTAAARPSEIFIFGNCGHFTCNPCRESRDRDDECVARKQEGCHAPAQDCHIHRAIDLGDDNAPSTYGAKVDAIIDLIKTGIPADDQILIFVQFDELMVNIAAALNAKGISNHALMEKSAASNASNMNDFQENTGDSKKKVLMLNPSNETAAGANLTNANHVIFVSPPWFTNKEDYHASLDQSIGRVVRYGQQKQVYIHKFLAQNTIDVDIMQKHGDEKLVRDNYGNWVMKARGNLTLAEQRTEWGTGITAEGYLETDNVLEAVGHQLTFDDLGEEKLPW